MPVNLTNVDYKGLKKVMARSTVLEAQILGLLSVGKAFAESISPDADPIGVGYKYRFGVEIHQFPDGVPIGTLFNDDPKWAVVEYGSSVIRRRGKQGGWSPARHVLELTLMELTRHA